jgi:flagellin
MAISLTAGMRSNLFGLQQTAKLMDTTSIRLNTGKKVNSALDDPISYFTAKNHMNRVSDLATLKNGMSEGIQTITAANQGIEAIMDLLEAAKAKAESAKSADATGTSNITSTVTLSSLEAGDTITVGGEIFTATDGTITGNGSGVVREFELVAGSDSLTAVNLASVVNSAEPSDVLATGINNATISFETSGADFEETDITYIDTSAFTENLVAAQGDERSTLVTQYETLMDQVDQLQNDAEYKGTNLLTSGVTLSVEFEGDNKLDVIGFAGDVTGLKLSATVTSSWNSDTNIETDITKLNTALDTLKSESSSLASSLSIVTVRQDFTENLINTLTTGADNLTLADMNEEGANMLMLQTQQALGTSSLSMAAQTAQGVLRLF